jgi:uncharacterized repeat protein (TIGR03803 family)
MFERLLRADQNLTAQTNQTNLTIQEIFSFPSSGNYGKTPNTLVQGSDGNLYGTTVGGGGSYTNGTVFRLSLGSPASVTYIAEFTGTTGAFPGSSPDAGLVQGTNGIFYGTTYAGGTSNLGTVFSITTNGSTNSLVSFKGTNGSHPLAPLVQGSDGNFYGTTSTGGTNGSTNGTVFKMTQTAGALTVLATFTGTNGALAGATPSAGLVQGSNDGYFYGTALHGGTNRTGTVFKISSSGATSNLVSFNPTNLTATNPVGGLIQASDGNFYGTTASPLYATPGSVFRMTSNGAVTFLYAFSSTNGKPNPGLIQGSDGNLYGTTPAGVSPGYGTVFQMTTNGAIIGLGKFFNTNGATPATSLIQASRRQFLRDDHEGHDQRKYGQHLPSGLSALICNGAVEPNQQCRDHRPIWGRGNRNDAKLSMAEEFHQFDQRRQHLRGDLNKPDDLLCQRFRRGQLFCSHQQCGRVHHQQPSGYFDRHRPAHHHITADEPNQHVGHQDHF